MFLKSFCFDLFLFIGSSSQPDHENIETKHDEYLMKLEERNRMKKQLLEMNCDEKLQNEKEKGFNLYINGANTSSKFDTQVISKGLRKSQHQPTARKTSKEIESGGDATAERARTAPAKRKKWTQDNDIEILTHRDGKLKFEGSEFQYKYSEDFTHSDDFDSGVLIASDENSCSGSLTASNSNFGGESDKKRDLNDEVVFDQKECDILRQSLRLDEVLRESVRESLMDETPSDSEIQEDLKESVVIEFGSGGPKKNKEAKVLKSSSAKSEPRCYTPTGRFNKPPFETPKGRSSAEPVSNLLENVAIITPKLENTSISTAYEPNSIDGDINSVNDSVSYPDNDIKDVVEKFKKLGVDQRRLLLEALAAESKDLAEFYTPKEVKSARPAYTSGDRQGFSQIESFDKVSKSMSTMESVGQNLGTSANELKSSSEKPTYAAIKTYRVNNQISSSGEKFGLQHLMQSASLSAETGSQPSDMVEIQTQTSDYRSGSQSELVSGTQRPESQVSVVSFSSEGEFPSRSSSRLQNYNFGNSFDEKDTFAASNIRDSVNVLESSENTITICLKLLSNWGDSRQIGLTGVQFLDENSTEIKCSKCSVINAVEQSCDMKVLLNKKTKTTKSSNMWSCMYTKYPVELFFTLNTCKKVNAVKLWNYNKSLKDLAKGVKNFEVKVNNVLVYSGELEKGCGNHIFDYEKLIKLEEKEDLEFESSESISKSFVLSPEATRSKTFGQQSQVAIENIPVDDSEFSLEELLNQSNGSGRNSALLNKNNSSPKKSTPAGIKSKKIEKQPKRKQLVKLSGIFDSLDLTTNEEFHYQPTPTPGSKHEAAQGDVIDEELFKQTGGNDRLDESWSHIFAFERARSGRRTDRNEKSDLDILKEIEREEKGSKKTPKITNPLSIRTFSSDSTSSIPDSAKAKSNFSSELKVCDWDSFMIPELPSGSRLVINILSTWGDKHYVGLNGIELFDSNGQKVGIAKIEADPSDINVLPEYSKDPRVVTNLVDGVNNTRDDTHMWLAPFTTSENHFVFITFERNCTLAMLRFWNYNKSRVHSSRGAKLVQVHLDGNPVFRGEIQRAGELGENYKETYGDTIMLTMDSNILSLVSENDELFLNDWNESTNCDESARPMTAGDDEGRPITVASNQKPGYVNFPSADCAVESMLNITDNLEMPKVATKRCSKVQFQFLEPWGDAFYMGLSGIQLLDEKLKPIKLNASMLEANPPDLNCLPEYKKDLRTVDKLVDGTNFTCDERHMWLIPFTQHSRHTLTITLPSETKSVSGFDVWNYNKSWEDSFRGVKRLKVFLDDVEISPPEEGYTLRRAPGHTCYNFCQRIEFSKYKAGGNVETDCPCGFVFTIMIQSSQNDLYYVGLDGIEFVDDKNRKVSIKQSQIDAYPRSVNELENVKADIRTPDKLVDGVNSSRDGSHSWLAPIFPNVNNKIYIIFDKPQPVSQIRVWNYSKTPSRGVKEVAVLVDDLIQYQGVLKPIMNVARGILPGMDTEVRFQAISLKDFNPEQCEMKGEELTSGLDNVKVQQTATGNNSSDAANQKHRPKTCVPRKYCSKIGYILIYICKYMFSKYVDCNCKCHSEYV